MRIAHINIFDSRVGIGNSVRALMAAQKQQGDLPTLFVPQRSMEDEDVVLISGRDDAWEQSMRSFEAREGVTGLASGNLFDMLRHPRFLDADVVHLHATSATYFSYCLLPALAAKPLIWSIYEAQPYTAGCSHTAMCQGWQLRNCLHCPLLPEANKDRSQEMLLLKKALYGLTPFAAVTANAWLTGQVRNSILSERFAAEISPAMDPVFFLRAEAKQVRQRLNIPQDAFVLACEIPGGLSHPMYGGPAILDLFDKWRTDNRNVFLLQLGGTNQDLPLPAPFERRMLPQGLPLEQRCAAFQAANIFLQFSPYDALGMSMLESMAAGIPPIAVSVAAGVQIRHLETGYQVTSDSTDEVLRAVLFLRRRQAFTKKMGQAAAMQIRHTCQPTDAAKEYRNIYGRLLEKGGRAWGRGIAEPMPQLPVAGDRLPALWKLLGIPERVANSLKQGIPELWNDLESCCGAYTPQRQRECGAFVDLYMSFLLNGARHPLSPAMLAESIDQWLKHRKLPQLCGDFSPVEKQALQAWTKLLRNALTHFLKKTPEDVFAQLSIFQQGRMVDLWRALFFNDCSTPYLEADEHQETRLQVESTIGMKRLYPDLLIRTMYTPFPPEAVKLDMASLLKRDMPVAIQVILVFWLVNVPYSDGDEKRQRIMRRNVTAFLNSAMQNTEAMPQNIFFAVFSHLVIQFWRAAYLGGNLRPELSLFGDFLHRQMRLEYPQFVEPISAKPRNDGRRLRIGYVSTNFCHQAVSYYMANRIFFADKQQFEVYVFSLEKRHDSMSDRIKSFSDKYAAFTNVDVKNLAEIAGLIKQSELDILVFADIGMEPINYQLGAMRLAPVQCVLVGHGATTGLPTMDYYLSGDFEGPDAQAHYREKLIRLPNLGAAQMPPAFPPSGKMNRADFGLPQDKVLLVSCANGIKHGPERDRLLVRILQQAPNAVIVLKPFMAPELVQPQWSRRVMAAARDAGVADRLLIVPPLEHGRDLMDFLAMSDIQLDTYPYGGWTTNMEAVYAGLAIVTQEGEQGRSRWGAHILRALGITAGIAKNEEDFVRQAVELVNNQELRLQVRRQIKERAVSTLFNGAAAQPAYEAELLRIYEQQFDQTQRVVQ